MNFCRFRTLRALLGIAVLFALPIASAMTKNSRISSCMRNSSRGRLLRASK